MTWNGKELFTFYYVSLVKTSFIVVEIDTGPTDRDR
jgi:hypothetical protein